MEDYKNAESSLKHLRTQALNELTEIITISQDFQKKFKDASVAGAESKTNTRSGILRTLGGDDFDDNIRKAVDKFSKNREKFIRECEKYSILIPSDSKFFSQPFESIGKDKLGETAMELKILCPSESEIDQWIMEQRTRNEKTEVNSRIGAGSRLHEVSKGKMDVSSEEDDVQMEIQTYDLPEGDVQCKQGQEHTLSDWLLESHDKLEVIKRTIGMAEHIEMIGKEELYSMTMNSIRVCLIIGNTHVNKSNPLPGAKTDCLYLETLFKKLEFQVTMGKDLTATGMRKMLKEMQRKYADCFVCAITSHGNQEGITTTDGKVIEYHEITDMFDRDNCKQMADKPKLFFFDACRGGSRETEKFSRPTSTPPLKSDMLVAYASSNEYVSYCDIEHGSWFIRTLVQVIKENACRYNITDMLSMVHRMVGTYKTEHNCQQSAEYRTSFRRQFFFYLPVENSNLNS